MFFKKVISFFIYLTVLLSYSSPVQAKIDLTFSQPPATIISDQSFPLDVTLTGVDGNSEYYIRGVFFSPNTTNYFGFTKNIQDEWVTSTTDHTKFYKIIGNKTETIHFKPDPPHPHFSGQNTYHFKIGRYTSGGSLTWSDQSPAEITIHHSATPTPTSSPPPATSTPSPSSNNTPQPTLITLSEVYACPATGSKEWIEIKNNHDHEVTLTNWLIRDNTASNKHEFTLTIPASGLGIVELSSSLLNNSGDSVKLVNQTNSEISAMSYSGCTEQSSLIPVNSEWVSTLSITKGSNNVYTPPSTPNNSTSTPTPVSSLSPTPLFSPRISPIPSSSASAPATASAETATISGLVLGNTVSLSTTSTDSPTTTKILDRAKPIGPIVIFSLLGGGGALVAVGIYIISEWYNQR